MFRKLTTQQLNRLTIYQYRNSPPSPVCIVLDNIRSMNNTGSIFRSADCFGVEHMHLCGITACPPHRDIHKTALGAEESLPWTYHSQSADACRMLKAQGYFICAVEQVEGSVYLGAFTRPEGQKLALVFGNETQGVSQEVLSLCDACIEIPQFGTKHSFNVSVCAGIVLWQLLG